MLRWDFPASVKVLPSKRASVVAIDNAIRVEHWYNFEDEILSQSLGFSSMAHEELYDSFHHPACIRLAWVDTRRDEDASLCLTLLTMRVLLLRSNRDVFTAVASECAAESASIHKVLREAIPFNPGQIVAQIRISIREAVGEVHLIIALGEGVRECQRVIAAIETVTLTLEAVRMIGDVAPDTMPAQLRGAVTRQLRKTKHPHTLVVERVRLRKV